MKDDKKYKNRKFFILGFLSYALAMACVQDKLGIPAFISFISSSIFLFIAARVEFDYNIKLLYFFSILSLLSGISCIFLIVNHI
ncbi:hypothetical protein [Acetobacter thailandicus]|uniref:hypothetical protein n=1 Tax=Acetobacter thailandicus TaxID=1502842 RepID=UPI001BA93B52|nr:hypothetical protein [Acetobacter thailandicus]MBS0985796.1 hypothetical protein [Acetobacter thailandicus]